MIRDAKEQYTDWFAFLLGFKESLEVTGSLHRLKVTDEGHRLAKLLQLVNNMREHGRWENMDPALSEFSALYLPKTVERFLNLPKTPGITHEIQRELLLNNAYLWMLWQIHQFPYFQRYLRSANATAASNGQKLARVITERLLDLAPLWDRYLDDPPPDRKGTFYPIVLSSILDVLASVLTAYITSKNSKKETILPMEMRWRLTRWVHKWVTRFPKGEIDDSGTKILMIFSGQPTTLQGLMEMRQIMAHSGCCGLPECEASEGLKECARCHTARYCSIAHQREHWNYPETAIAHKYNCYETEY